MSFPDLCSWVTPYVSTPEWICPPPAPSLQDQVMQTIATSGPILVGAAAASVALLRPFVSKSVRHLANGALLTTSIATIAGTALTSSGVGAILPAALGVGGLVYGAMNLRKDLQPNDRSQAIKKDLAALATPITDTMGYDEARILMSNKLISLGYLHHCGKINLTVLDIETKEVLDRAFTDLETFLKIYWNEALAVWAEIDAAQTGKATADSHSAFATRLANQKSTPDLCYAFFYAHQLYTMAKVGLQKDCRWCKAKPNNELTQFFDQDKVEARWRRIYNAHCQSFTDLNIKEEIQKIDERFVIAATTDDFIGATHQTMIYPS